MGAPSQTALQPVDATRGHNDLFTPRARRLMACGSRAADYMSPNSIISHGTPVPVPVARSGPSRAGCRCPAARSAAGHFQRALARGRARGVPRARHPRDDARRWRARAGVAEGTIFHRFKSKEELFRAAMQFDPDQALAFVERCRACAGTGDLRADAGRVRGGVSRARAHRRARDDDVLVEPGQPSAASASPSTGRRAIGG